MSVKDRPHGAQRSHICATRGRVRVRVCTSGALFPSQCEMKWEGEKNWIRRIFNKWVDRLSYASFVDRWRYRQHTITWPGEAANQEQNKRSPWQRTAWQVSWEHEERSAGITFSWASWNCPLSSASTGPAWRYPESKTENMLLVIYCEREQPSREFCVHYITFSSEVCVVSSS